MKKLFSDAYYFLVVGKEKAVGGALVAIAGTLVLQHLGYHVSSGLQQALTALAVGGLVHVSVYATRNR